MQNNLKPQKKFILKSFLNKKIFSLHSWLGIISGIFILIFSLTGSLIVFSNEIDKLQYPEFYNVQIQSKKLSITQCYKIIVNQYNDANITGIKRLATQSNESHQFDLQNKNNQIFSVFIDPYTGNILGEKHNSIAKFLKEFHYTFSLGKFGEFLAAIFSICFIGSIITGLIVYRKFIFKVLLFKIKIRYRNQKTLFSDLHHIFGVWTLLFNLILATGGFLMMNYALDVKTHFVEPEQERFSKFTNLKTDFDNILNQTNKKLPGFAITYIYLPTDKDSNISINGDIPGKWWLGEYNNYVNFTQDNKFVYMSTENELSSKEQFDSIIYTLHYGRYGGKLIKILQCLVGLTTSSLTITGFIIFYKRKKFFNYKKIVTTDYVD